MTFNELMETFALMDDWEDRYGLLIQLGGQLEPMPEALKVKENKVEGCTSQVWMVLRPNPDNRIDFVADSDAHIVRGLIAVLSIIYQGKTYVEARALDIEDIFTNLGLSSHLSPNRRNGFFAMVERLKNLSAG